MKVSSASRSIWWDGMRKARRAVCESRSFRNLEKVDCGLIGLALKLALL